MCICELKFSQFFTFEMDPSTNMHAHTKPYRWKEIQSSAQRLHDGAIGSVVSCCCRFTSIWKLNALLVFEFYAPTTTTAFIERRMRFQ